MPDGAKPGPGGWNRIHLIVADIDAEVDRLRDAGVQLPQRHRRRTRRQADPGRRTPPATSSSCSNPPAPDRQGPRRSISGLRRPRRPRSSPRAPSDGPWPTAAPSVARGPSRTSSARSPSLRGRSGLHVLGVVEVDVPAAGACEFGQHLAVHDGVGAALVRHATLHGDVRRGSRAARLGATSRRSVRATRWRARPVQPTSREPPTPAPARPAPRRRRRRAACLRGGSVRSPCRVRSARSAGGPRPRGRPTP